MPVMRGCQRQEKATQLQKRSPEQSVGGVGERCGAAFAPHGQVTVAPRRHRPCKCGRRSPPAAARPLFGQRCRERGHAPALSAVPLPDTRGAVEVGSRGNR